MAKKHTPRIVAPSGTEKVSVSVAAALTGGESAALLDFRHFQSVQDDPAIVTAAGITNGMHPDEIVRRILAVSPRPV